MTEPLNILLTGAGRHASLVAAFRQSLACLDMRGCVHVAERSPLSPALHLADDGILLPPAEGPHGVESLLKICRRHAIGLVIPLGDEDMLALAQARQRFAEAGVRVVVCSPGTIETCRDRRRLSDLLGAAGLKAPRLSPARKPPPGEFPALAKPGPGSSAAKAHGIPDPQAMAEYRGCIAGVIQAWVEGDEFLVDVYVGLDGVPRAAVPRKCLETRGGETCKAQTVRHEAVIGQSMQAAGALAECAGVITIQCFVSRGQEVTIGDVSPHWDGGAALAIRAGADFPRWIIQEHLGRKPDCEPNGWQDGLVALQYDGEVFCRVADFRIFQDSLLDPGLPDEADEPRGLAIGSRGPNGDGETRHRAPGAGPTTPCQDKGGS